MIVWGLLSIIMLSKSVIVLFIENEQQGTEMSLVKMANVVRKFYFYFDKIYIKIPFFNFSGD